MHVCFRRSEPRVIFGTSDSGVADPARDDGVPLLDEIRAGALFGGRSALAARGRATVSARVSAGLLGGADGDRAVRTARNASYAP